MEDILGKGNRRKILEQLISKMSRDFGGDEEKAKECLDKKVGPEWRSEMGEGKYVHANGRDANKMFKKIKDIMEEYEEASQDLKERMPLEKEPVGTVRPKDKTKADDKLQSQIQIIIKGI